MVNNYQLKSRILIEVDVFFVTGRSATTDTLSSSTTTGESEDPEKEIE